MAAAVELVVAAVVVLVVLVVVVADSTVGSVGANPGA